MQSSEGLLHISGKPTNRDLAPGGELMEIYRDRALGARIVEMTK